jgi:hypothetical protein
MKIMAHHIVTAQEMLSAGVTLLLEEKTVNRRCVNSHLKTFLDHFGVRASTACSIYEDLQVKVGVVTTMKVSNGSSFLYTT